MATGKDPVVFYNVDQWLEDNSKFFSPPVCNKMMHNAGQMKSFFVGGPNQRKDYHIEVGEELFYMLKGDMCLKVVEHGRHRDVHIKEGEIFLLPGKIAHSPQRQADTVGLVIERERAETELDGLRYFVEKDGKPTLESLYEDWFHCTDLGTQLPPVIKRFFASEQCKTGKPVPGTIPVAPPVVLDSERSLQEPFLLSEWIAQNRDEIRSQGSKRLFGNGYQFQVDVLGCGETSGGHDVAETWIWQLEGSASVKVGEKSYSLGANDSLLIKAGQRYTVQQNKEGIALSCFQDPSRA